MIIKRHGLSGLPLKLYRHSVFWYWKRYMGSDPFRLLLGGGHYRDDFWFHLNQGWYDMRP